MVFYAPDKAHHHVKNHVTGQDHDTDRNVLIESARIARGKDIHSLEELTVDSVEAVIFPGGFGAAKNLCSFATDAEPQVDEQVARVIRQFVEAGKPMGFCCIAPILAALVLAKEDGKLE